MPNAEGGFEDIRTELDGHPMKSLFGYVAPYWKRLSAGIVLSFIMRLSRLVPALAIAAAIDRAINMKGDPGPLADVGLITSAQIQPETQIPFLHTLAIIVGGAWVIQSIAQFSSQYLFQSTAQQIQHDLRSDTYSHMQRLSMTFFNDHQTGGMMSILNSDINRLENFFNSEIRQMIRAVVMVGVVGAVMLYLEPTLGLIALAPLPIIGLTTGTFLRWIEPKYRRIREQVAQLNTRLSNNLGGAAVIKSFNRYGIEENRVDEQSAVYRDQKTQAIKIRRAFFSSLKLVIGAVFVTFLVVGGTGVINGAITIGTLTLFFMFLRRLRGPMRRLGKTANKYQKAKSSAERVFGILDHEPIVTSPANPHDPAEIRGDISVENVTFSYDGHDETILDGVDLDVPAGATVGFAGTSGSGKSTLLKLIPRFHDVDTGAVRVDDVDVRDYEVQRLRDEIGVVEQDPYMFSGTIRENIAYGDRELFATLTEEDGISDRKDHRLKEAARAAGAHKFIESLPDGYETQVGERGVKLSGGQRQRVSIARTLLNDPSIIILDEATSDVDTETEQIIQENLDRIIDDRTAFIIAHRLSTIRDADRIIVMEDGSIIESGTHDELIDSAGTYAELWASQSDMSTPTDSDAESVIPASLR